MPTLRSTLAAAAALAALSLPLLAAPTHAADGAKPVTFTVTVENVSGPDTLKLPDGKALPAPIAPGAYAVFRQDSPLFTAGRKASSALERLAEDGATKDMEAALKGRPNSGVFAPGIAFEVTAKPGDKLSFATMFVQSNDWFYGPKDGAIALFNKYGKPLSGDVTVRVDLFDAGTEISEPPGVGPNQAPRQGTLNTGPSEDKPVRAVGHEFQVPPVAAVIKVTVIPATAAIAV